MIDTERLILRDWRDADLAPFAALNADAEVMRFFPRPLDRAASDALVARIRARAAEDGICFMPVERRADGAFLGFCGLARVRPPIPCAPAIEIGWRLARDAWGQGYATEAARAWLAHGFGSLDLPEIVAFAVTDNLRSRAVMDRIGMVRDPVGDFDHPAVPEGPLRRQVLYRVSPPRR